MDLERPTFIDLFCGCGGFSLGLRNAGFVELGAIDFNPEAILVFKRNFPDDANLYQKDLTEYEPQEFEKLINTKEVDLIVGGPPCQGFSTVRQRDGSNSGMRIINDNRRELYQELLKFVDYFKPKIFVMENVLGIRSAAGGHFFNKVQSEARDLGYRVHGEIIKAWEYGVPQKRERQLIIGTRLDLPLFSKRQFFPATHSMSPDENQEKIITLGEAIDDLPSLEAGGGSEIMQYDLHKRDMYKVLYSGRYLNEVLEVEKSLFLTSHRARPHNNRDLRDFLRLHEGETSIQAITRGEHMEFPYDRESFKDRYTRQNGNKLCSTIVAHLSKDGLMFIHPTQNRSLTPREAARIQTFPDWFEFPVARTHQFRLIGNAVPPLVARDVGLGIKKWLKDLKESIFSEQVIETITQKNAINWLQELLDSNGNLHKLTPEQFKEGWFSISYFFNHLHPDSAKENGDMICEESSFSNPILEKINPKLIKPIYERSGWPVLLAKYAKEAQRRRDLGELSLEDLYSSKIHVLGFKDLDRGIFNGNKRESKSNTRR